MPEKKEKAPESEKPEPGTTTALVQEAAAKLPVGVSDDVALSTLDVPGREPVFVAPPEKKPRKRTATKKKTTATKRKAPAKKTATTTAEARRKGKA